MARYDSVSMRYVLTPAELERLPVRRVTYEELYELMCEWEYNPVDLYASPASPPLPGEVGHDRRARYVCGPTA